MPSPVSCCHACHACHARAATRSYTPPIYSQPGLLFADLRALAVHFSGHGIADPDAHGECGEGCSHGGRSNQEKGAYRRRRGQARAGTLFWGSRQPPTMPLRGQAHKRMRLPTRREHGCTSGRTPPPLGRFSPSDFMKEDDRTPWWNMSGGGAHGAMYRGTGIYSIYGNQSRV